MRKRIGIILMGIAALHEIVGLIVYSEALLDILNAGILNSVNPPDWERDAAFWFLMFGALLFLLGWAAQWALDNTGIIPTFMGWGILAVCVVGIILMPASGFWLAIPVALMMLRMDTPQAADSTVQNAEKATS